MRHVATVFSRMKQWVHRYRYVLLFALVLVPLLSFQTSAIAQDAANQAQESNATSQTVGAGDLQAAQDAALGVSSGLIDLTGTAILTLLATIFAALGTVIGWLITSMIGIIVIPVLGYNGFADSFIISIGWPLIRDMVNMFVIVVLLYIAIKTMLGIGGGAQAAQQNILRLFIAVVLVNFSKTLALLAVDLSQVVMFTFVNALQDIAAGNFVELFQINAFLSTSFNEAQIQLQGADTFNGSLNALTFLASSYIGVVLLSTVLVSLLVLAVVFIYRIVVLWILVIVSPAAFFFMGIGSAFPGGAGIAAQWRKMFVGALTIGPVLTFFLWLALATASQGATIAQTENFPGAAETGDVTGVPLGALNIEHLLSLLVGLILLQVGIQVAASSAGALGGVAGTSVAKLKGWTGKLATAPVALPAKFVGKGAKLGGKAAAPFVARGLENFGGDIQGKLGQVSADLRNSNALGRLVAPAFGVAGNTVANAAGGKMEEYRKRARSEFSGMSDEEKAGLIQRAAQGGIEATTGLETAFLEQAAAFSLDKPEKAQKFLKDHRGMTEDLAKSSVVDLSKQTQNLSKDRIKAIYGSDDKAEKKIDEMEVRNISFKEGTKQKDYEETYAKAVQKGLTSSIPVDAFRNAGAVEGMKSVVTNKKTKDENGNERYLSLLESIAKSEPDPEKRKAAQEALQLGVASAAAKKIDDFGSATAQEIGGAISSGKNKAADISVQAVQNNPTEVVQGLVLSNASEFGGMDDAAKDEILTAIERQRAGASEEMKEQLDVLRYNLSKDMDSSFGLSADGSASDESSAQALFDVVERDPESITKLSTHAQQANSTGQSTTATKAILNAYNTKMVKAMKEEFRKAGTTAERKDAIKSIVRTLADSAGAEFEASLDRAGRDPARIDAAGKKARELNDEIRVMARYFR